MSWVEQNKHHFQDDPVSEISRYLRASGVDVSLMSLAGSYGVRRFLIYFERRGRQIKVTNLESLTLQNGGGPPPPDPNRQRLMGVEQSLWRLHMNMSTGPKWNKGCLGFVRDCDNNYSMAPFFGEDRELASLELLPVPKDPHPLEMPDYRHLLGSFEAQMAPVFARTSAITADWDFWEVTGQTLTLIYGKADFPNEVRNERCIPLATYSISRKAWTWQVESPLFEQTVYCWESFLCSWDAAMELGLLTVARLDASWLFTGSLDDGDQSLLLAVWDG